MLVKLLRPYQKQAIHYLQKNNGGCLFIEMRLGKTLTTIRYLKKVMSMQSKILIVAPYSVLAGWEQELKGERQLFTYLTGTKKERSNNLLIESNYYLINKEGFLSLPEIKNIDWFAIVLDESTFIKNPKSKVSKFYTKNFSTTPVKIILTGTPAPETELDYFQQLYFVNPDILNIKNYYHFRMYHFNKYGFDFKIRSKSKELLNDKLQKNCFFLKRKDVNLGGEKIYQTRNIKLDSKLQKVYNKLKEDFILEYENTRLKTKWAPVAYTRMKQLSSGFIDKKIVSLHKVNELLSILGGELSGQQVVIWCQYIHEITYIQSVLIGKAGIIYGGISPADREKTRQLFQSDSLQYLIIQPETFKFGVSLSSAETMIYFSSPESYLTRSQTEDRTLNLQKNNSILIIDLLTEKTVDILINKSIKNKANKQTFFKEIYNDCNN